MRMLYLGLVAVFSGFILLLLGGVQAGIFIVFPFIISSGPLGFAGAVLIFAGFILLFLGFLPSKSHFESDIHEKAYKRGIGIVMIGPIPLIIDSKNKTLSLISLVIFIIAVILMLLFYLGALA